MRKIQIVPSVILMIICIACSQSSKKEKVRTSSTDITGHWYGKTSQGYTVWLDVELVNDSLFVTRIYYQGILIPAGDITNSIIELRNSLADEMKTNISDGKFSYSEDDYKISGFFKGKTLTGKLSATATNSLGNKIKITVDYTLIK